MKVVVACSLLVAAGTAHADVAAEVSAGAGGDTSTPQGFASTTLVFEARADRAIVPTGERGAVLRDLEHPDDPGRLWIFTGIDPDDHDSAGLTANGSLHVAPGGERPTSAWLASRAWARGAGWEAGARLDLQPLGDLRDVIWRSGREVALAGGSLDIPAMWSLGDARTQFSAALIHIDLGRRFALDGNAAHDAGWDRDISLIGARLYRPTLTLDLLGFHYHELGVAEASDEMHSYGTSATAFDIDLAGASWRIADDLVIAAHGGIAMRSPVSPYVTTGTSEMSLGPIDVTPTYWLEVRDRDTWTLGAGSWSRLDPTGHAVDDGQLVAGSAHWRTGDYRFTGTLEGGRLTRALVGELAPPGVVPVGTTRWMGRGELAATANVTHALALTASTWLERSDRDDPRWATPATGALASHAGAEVTAAWRL